MVMALGIAFFLIGSVVMVVGVISVIRPITAFKIKTRKDGVVVVLAGLLTFIFSLFLAVIDGPEDAVVATGPAGAVSTGASEEAIRVEETQRMDEPARVKEAASPKQAARVKEVEQHAREVLRQVERLRLEEHRKERKFIDVIWKYRAAYKSAANDIKRFNYVKGRSEELREILHCDLEIKNWVGNLVKLTTDSGGDADIAVALADGIVLGTYGFFQDIKTGTPLWEQVAELSIGQEVVFSGHFFASTSARFPKEVSLTERGNMAEPEFHFDFLSIKPRGARRRL